MTGIDVRCDSSAMRAALDAIAGRFKGAVQQALNVTVENTVRAAKGSTRFKDKSGALRGSIKSTVGSSAFTRMVSADRPYARWVEFGNRPGGTGDRIYPRRAKFLRFELNVFRKSVRAHGPLPFLGDAREQAVKQLPANVAEYVGRIMRP